MSNTTERLKSSERTKARYTERVRRDLVNLHTTIGTSLHSAYPAKNAPEGVKVGDKFKRQFQFGAFRTHKVIRVGLKGFDLHDYASNVPTAKLLAEAFGFDYLEYILADVITLNN